MTSATFKVANCLVESVGMFGIKRPGFSLSSSMELGELGQLVLELNWVVLEPDKYVLELIKSIWIVLKLY